MYRNYLPPPALAEFVDFFWVHEEDWHQPLIERVLPAGMADLVIDLTDEDERSGMFDERQPHFWRRAPRALLRGVQSTWYLECFGQRVSEVGARFKSGGLGAFLPVPASDLHNTEVSLETLWGRSAITLREQIMAAPDPDARVQVLVRALLARMTRSYALHPAVSFALQAFLAQPRPQMIAQVADQSGLSHRQFIAVFRHEVGMSPKQFCRVHRFLQVLCSTKGTGQINWAEVAQRHGYYDQAHLIHDFQEFAGISPTAYLRDRNERFPMYVALALPEVNFSQDSYWAS